MESLNSVSNLLHTTQGLKYFNTAEFAISIADELFISDNKKPILIACIGTDKSIVDSLGPFVGTMLLNDPEFVRTGIKVVGTLDKPCHALNINELLQDDVLNSHYVIAIDACLGCENDFGRTDLRRSPVKPGRGAGKELKTVGDISIITILGNKMDGMDIGKRINTTYQYARKISNSIVIAFSNFVDGVDND